MNAPVSFGVWGPHAGPPGVSGADVLGAVAAAGYTGAELGPPGYLGSLEQTAQAFVERGLQAAGVYVGLHLRAAPAGLSAQERAVLESVCRSVLMIQHLALDAGAGQAALPLGPVVLADEGSDELRNHPARDSAGPAGRGLAIDDVGWVDAATTIRQAQALIADHVHLKDVRLDVLAAARRTGAPRIDGWWGSACVPFGTGDVDLHGVVSALAASDYRGWIVVEQDHMPGADDDLAALGAEQAANRRWLEAALATLVP